MNKNLTKGEHMSWKMKFKMFMKIILAVGLAFTSWEILCILTGLKSVGWCPIELSRQLMVAMGLFPVIHTLVDYYTHVKAVEYIIVIAFLAGFPLFHKYMSKSKITLDNAV